MQTCCYGQSMTRLVRTLQARRNPATVAERYISTTERRDWIVLPNRKSTERRSFSREPRNQGELFDISKQRVDREGKDYGKLAQPGIQEYKIDLCCYLVPIIRLLKQRSSSNSYPLNNFVFCIRFDFFLSAEAS
jgi:hypothetical protein